MNLEDVIDVEYGLQQDEWSLSKPVFGEDSQIEVIGWSGRVGTNKLYIVKCHECSKDRELFGDGVFKSLKSNFVNNGQIPCGCSKVKWSKDQWIVKAERKAEQLGYKVINHIGLWKGGKTKIKLYCPEHGEWDTTTFSALVHQEHGCPQCISDKISSAMSKPDSEMVASFFASGAFPQGTKFWRSDRKSKDGVAKYWNIWCPECDGNGEATSHCLQKGSRPCLCSPARQRQAYINIIKDGNNPFAIKFGIANSAKRRVTEQNKSSVYSVENHLVFAFPTKQECRAAELQCKRELQCALLSKEEMPDGYTETTHLFNLNKIIEIYKKHNGVIYES